MTPRRTLFICVAILAVAAGLILVIFKTEPTATKSGATKQTAMLVDVITVGVGRLSADFRSHRHRTRRKRSDLAASRGWRK